FLRTAETHRMMSRSRAVSAATPARCSPDLWTAFREDGDDAWSTPTHLDAPVSSTASETRASLSWDGETMVFGSTRAPSEAGSTGQVGVDLTGVGAGEPVAMNHDGNDPRDLLGVAGEALLIIEGEEGRLHPWNFVHCPPGTNHGIVRAGETPCVVVAVGARE